MLSLMFPRSKIANWYHQKSKSFALQYNITWV
uniref:Uncharacterized protein n=1 Tax=Anguilla anguilla TaxID=7936 RepID=A0A0E9SL43_ANGAN